MTPEEQRIAIAKACGWELRDIYWYGDGKECEVPPNYLNDLNAMHEAEKTALVHNYRLHSGDECVEQNYLRRISKFAAATQRAEAFLRTLNLWKD
jgi:hypothetical protein